MFQNVLMDPKILKEKKKSLFFSMFFGIIVSLPKKKLNFCIFSISYTCLHIISLKCKICVISFEYVEIISRD